MINVYVKEVKKQLEKKAPDCDVREATVVKRNDNVMYGVSIDEKSGKAAPTFYLNEAFMNDIPPEKVADDILDRFFYEMSRNPLDVNSSEVIDLSFENIKENLSLRLLDTEMNSMYMEEHPAYRIIDRFAYAVVYNITDEFGTVLTKDLIEKNDLSIEELYKKALSNEQDNVVLTSLDPFGFSISNENNNYFHNGKNPEGSLFILTNKDARFGANTMFYPGVLKKVRNLLGEDFYIIPSSVHEVLVIRDSFVDDPKNLKDMLKEGNRKLCSPEEVLAELPFHYSSEEGFEVLDK